MSTIREDSLFRLGSRYGRLTVSGDPVRIDGYIRYECICDCGFSLLVKKTAMKSGNTKSCGCLARDVKSKIVPPIGSRTRHSTCEIDGCNTPSRSKFGKWCEKHYYRNRRKRSFDDPEIKGRLKTEHGYILLKRRDHPMRHKSTGYAYEHRVILYDSVGGKNQECHWCKCEIVWFGDGERIVVDRLDNNKENNDESNLVASCHKCNSVRGLFMKWVHDHIDDPFLTKLFNQSNSGPDGFPLKPRRS